jgi:hypothetical protein
MLNGPALLRCLAVLKRRRDFARLSAHIQTDQWLSRSFAVPVHRLAPSPTTTKGLIGWVRFLAASTADQRKHGTAQRFGAADSVVLADLAQGCCPPSAFASHLAVSRPSAVLSATSRCCHSAAKSWRSRTRAASGHLPVAVRTRRLRRRFHFEDPASPSSHPAAAGGIVMVTSVVMMGSGDLRHSDR